jgi:hypothetical protein
MIFKLVSAKVVIRVYDINNMTKEIKVVGIADFLGYAVMIYTRI